MMHVRVCLVLSVLRQPRCTCIMQTVPTVTEKYFVRMKCTFVPARSGYGRYMVDVSVVHHVQAPNSFYEFENMLLKWFES